MYIYSTCFNVLNVFYLVIFLQNMLAIGWITDSRDPTGEEDQEKLYHNNPGKG